MHDNTYDTPIMASLKGRGRGLLSQRIGRLGVGTRTWRNGGPGVCSVSVRTRDPVTVSGPGIDPVLVQWCLVF